MTEQQPLSDEQLAAIQTRVDNASDGPWHTHSSRWSRNSSPDSIIAGDNPDNVIVHQQDEQGGPSWTRDEDAKFMAHARQDIPALIAEIMW